MILGAFTIFYVLLSLVASASGVVVVYGLLAGSQFVGLWVFAGLGIRTSMKFHREPLRMAKASGGSL